MFRSPLAALALAVAATIPAHALPMSDGTELQCSVSRAGKTGIAKENWVQYDSIQNRDPELGKAVAVVRTDAAGWPVIYIDAVAHRRGRQSNAGLWDFVFLHECAHAQEPGLTEIGANCSAYIEMERRGLMNPIRFKDIEAAHLQILNLPEEYGGNGVEFWRRTMECVHAKNGADKSAGRDSPPR
jgi:hypothetical protein